MTTTTTAMNTISVKLQHQRDTKGYHVYATEADGAAIRNVYIARGSFKDETPASISLSVLPA